MIKHLYQTEDSKLFDNLLDAEKQDKLIKFSNALAKRIWLKDMREDQLAFALKGFFQNQLDELAFLFDSPEE